MRMLASMFGFKFSGSIAWDVPERLSGEAAAPREETAGDDRVES